MARYKPIDSIRKSNRTDNESAKMATSKGVACICPAGKSLYQNGANCNHKGLIGTKFQGALRDCVPCALREKCLRTPEKTQTRQVM